MSLIAYAPARHVVTGLSVTAALTVTAALAAAALLIIPTPAAAQACPGNGTDIRVVSVSGNIDPALVGRSGKEVSLKEVCIDGVNYSRRFVRVERVQTDVVSTVCGATLAQNGAPRTGSNLGNGC
ncbi:hypothetical protein P7L70_04915 (plasmid) [Tistrella mobilis]|uniref:hypothetical protein n=1 Tax=Tistrella mobilis TaxID=171437 RepID=UPI003559367E